MTNGMKTSEFWLTLAAVLVGALSASDLFPVESPIMKVIAVAGAVLTTLGYTVSRGMVKTAEAKKEAIKTVVETE